MSCTHQWCYTKDMIGCWYCGREKIPDETDIKIMKSKEHESK